MNGSIFTGVGTAIVTPFSETGVDLTALRRLIERQITGGVNAIVVCGTTGEASTMTSAERESVISCCVEQVGGRVPVIAGSGSNDTRAALEHSLAAQRAGADALLLVTPYYNKATQQGLLRHYTTVADRVSIPAILYNVPSRTGVDLLPETCAELALHPNIAGIKEASGDLGRTQRLRALCPDDFAIWAGNDGDTAAVCMLGGSGVISVASNLIPREMRRLTDLCFSNDFAAAGALQIRLKPLFDALFCEVNPIPVKTALGLMGLDAGVLRLPLCPPSSANLAKLKLALAAWDLLPEHENIL